MNAKRGSRGTLARILRAAVGIVLLGCAGCGGLSVWAGEGKRVVRLDAPGVLDRPGTEYVLTRDVTAPGTAFTIDASDVTLNLGGHTVVYGGGGEEKGFGVEVSGFHRRNIRIVEGKIVQAADSRCIGDANARGCNPVFIPQDAQGVEIASLQLEYHTPNTSGIYMHWAKDAELHGNTMTDRGDRVDNRHQGVAAVENSRGRGLVARDNRIVRTRQIGIRTGEDADIRSNRIAIDSVVTNSTGIAVKSGSIRGNRVEGEGVHPIGIWPGNRTDVEENFVRVRSTRAGEEYGSTGAACLRMTWGNDDVRVAENIFILEAPESGGERTMDGWGRALWVGLPHTGEKALFERNLIVANNLRGESKAAAIAVVCNNVSSGLVFRNNTVISNWGNVLLGDDYGHADGFPRFIANTFVRQDDFSSYRTIRGESPTLPSTADFIGNRYLNGAGTEQIDLPWGGEGKKELRFGRGVTLEIRDEKGSPVRGADVTIRSASGETFSGTTGSLGTVSAEITDYRLTRPPLARDSAAPPTSGRELMRREEGPHTLTVTRGKSRVVQKLEAADGRERLRVTVIPGFSESAALPEGDGRTR